MGTILKARIQQKYETKENWDLLKPGDFIPLNGEICYTTIDNQVYMKIGNGETDFTDLPWLVNQADWYETDTNAPGYIKNKICDIVSQDNNILFYDVETYNQGENIEWGPFDTGDETYQSWVMSTFDIPQNSAITHINEKDIYSLQFEGLGADYLGPEMFQFQFAKGINQDANNYFIYLAGNKNPLKGLNMVLENENRLDDNSPFTLVITDTGNDLENIDIPRYMIGLVINPEYFSPQGLATYSNPKIYLEKEIEIKQIDQQFIPNYISDNLELNSFSPSFIKNRKGILSLGELNEPWNILPETVYKAGDTLYPLYRWDPQSPITEGLFAEAENEEIFLHLNESPVIITIDGVEYKTRFHLIAHKNYNCNTNLVEKYEYLLTIGNLQEAMNFISNDDYIGYKGNYIEENDVPFSLALSTEGLYAISSNTNNPFYISEDDVSIKEITVSIRIEELPGVINPISNTDIVNLPTPLGDLNEKYNSIMFNYSLKAEGLGSIALGTGTSTESEANNSIAGGNYNIVEGKNSFSIGQRNLVKGSNSIAGGQHQLINNSCGAFSSNTKFSDKTYTVIKTDNNTDIAYHTYELAGDYTELILNYNYIASPNLDTPNYLLNLHGEPKFDEVEDITTFIAYGYDNREQNSQIELNFIQISTISDYSIVGGENNNNLHSHSAVFGKNNSTSNEGSLIAGINTKISADTLFAIGNGSEELESNAIEVKHDGTITGQDLIFKGANIDMPYFYKSQLANPFKDIVVHLSSDSNDNIEIRNKNLFKNDFANSDYITLSEDGALIAQDNGEDSIYSTTLLLPPGDYILSNGLLTGNINFYIQASYWKGMVKQTISTKLVNYISMSLDSMQNITLEIIYMPNFVQGEESIVLYPQLELSKENIPTEFVAPKFELVTADSQGDCILNLTNYDEFTSIVSSNTNITLQLQEDNASLKENIITDLVQRIMALESQIQELINQ